MTNPSNKVAVSLLGLVAFLGVGLVTGVLYVIVVGKLLDRNGDGFGLTAAIIMFPIFAVLSGGNWIGLWLLHLWKWGPMSTGRVILLSTALGLLISLIVVGPRGFTPHGGSTLINYFLIGSILVGALGHRVIANSLFRRSCAPSVIAPSV